MKIAIYFRTFEKTVFTFPLENLWDDAIVYITDITLQFIGVRIIITKFKASRYMALSLLKQNQMLKHGTLLNGQKNSVHICIVKPVIICGCSRWQIITS